MEINSRQIVSLAAPVIVSYLTWSAVSGTISPAAQPEQSSSISTVAASKRPVIPALTRDVFSKDGSIMNAEFATAPGAAGSNDAMHLNGTVVAGKWRMAIIDGTRVFEGQTYKGYDVKRVGPDSVTLVNGSSKPIQLSLEIAASPPLPSVQKADAVQIAEVNDTWALKPDATGAPDAPSARDAKAPAVGTRPAQAAAKATALMKTIGARPLPAAQRTAQPNKGLVR